MLVVFKDNLLFGQNLLHFFVVLVYFLVIFVLEVV